MLLLTPRKSQRSLFNLFLYFIVATLVLIDLAHFVLTKIPFFAFNVLFDNGDYKLRMFANIFYKGLSLCFSVAAQFTYSREFRLIFREK